MTTKNIIGKPRIRNYEIGDMEELLRRADSYVEPFEEKVKKVDKEKRKKTSNSNFYLRYITDINEYNDIKEYLDKTFPNHKNILSKKLEFKDNVMKGSSIYIATAIDRYLDSINSQYRISREIDLEQDISKFTGFYVDSGLALRNLTGNSSKQAVYLFEQLKKKGIKLEDFPIWINLRDLVLDNDLNFNLTPKSLYKPKAECLNWENGTKYSKIDDFGLPKEKDNNSSRKIWTSDNALSRAYLDWDSNLGPSSSALSSSNDYGRVVLAKVRSTWA